LAARAIDAFNNAKLSSETCKEILKYLNTDTIWCGYILHLLSAKSDFTLSFPEEHPEILVELQRKHWSPILEWVRARYGVEIRIFNSVLQSAQPQETLKHFKKILADMDMWSLAGEQVQWKTTHK
jgi:ATP synthase mitochondrial F1 complex assembly factor 2